MRNPAPRALISTLLILSAACAAAQGVTGQKPAIAPKDYGKWEALGSPALSPDGQWLAYPLNRDNGQNELRLVSLASDAKPESNKTVAFGSSPSFSADSRWLAYTVGYSEIEREQATKASRTLQDKLGLVELAAGKTTVLDGVNSFQFSDDGAYLAMRSYPASGKRSKGADLVVRDLATGADTNFGNVSAFAWREKGPLLALIIDAENKSGNGVQVYDPAHGSLRTLDSSKETYTGLSWRPKDDDLAVIRQRQDDAYKDDTDDLLVWKDLSEKGAVKKTYVHSADKSFPVDFRIVDTLTPLWVKDSDLVLVGIKEREKKGEAPKPAAAAPTAAGPQPADTKLTETKPMEAKPTEAKPADPRLAPSPEPDDPAGVEVWHAGDVDILPRQKLTASGDRNSYYTSVWHPNSSKLIRLEVDLRETTTAVKGGKRLLIQTPVAYQRDRMFGPDFWDIYVADPETGQRTLIQSRLEYRFGISPEGRYFHYFLNDHYWTYDLRTGKKTNVTEHVPAEFMNREDDHTVKQKPPFGVAGWLKGDAAILLYDRYDVWQVRPDGSGATRLTDGARDEVRYRYERLDPEEEAIDPEKPLYFNLYGEWSKRTGYARAKLGETPERLIWQDKLIRNLVKAKKSETFLYTSEDFADSPDYLVAGPRLSDARQVTETNAFQKDYAWGRAELIEYRNKPGKRLQGALYYPAIYDPAQQYPMVVLIYEKLSPRLHLYMAPSERTPYNISEWTSKGYFVLCPDIVYRPRQPGVSAVECLIPAVEKVLASGKVDRSKVALIGHSWGAYQTAFVVTQTDLFAAAVAGAPLTNLMSMYLTVYWNNGNTNARIFEISQGRMEVPFWEDQEAYIANSPVFHITKLKTPLLVAFGDKDGAVDWHQGVELYNAARRAGKTNMVMLVYEGENHSLARKPNQLDYHRRIGQWFGHYLSGEPAPRWVTNGLSYLDRQKELEKARSASPSSPK